MPLTPPHTHKTIATDCLEAGKHVFCEKPITPTYSAFKELWAIAQANNRQLIENHNYRFNAPIIAIKQMVPSGVLGEVQEVEVRNVLPLRSGGRLVDEHLPSPLHALPAGAIHDFHHASLLASFTFCAEVRAGARRMEQSWWWHALQV